MKSPEHRRQYNPTKAEQIQDALEHARELAYEPLVHMNRKERRTKMGRIIQTACEEKLRRAVLVVLEAAKDIPDDE
jgi:hypothetical protein